MAKRLKTSWIFFGMAVFLGVVSLGMMLRMNPNKNAHVSEQTQAIKTRPILVALDVIPAGTRITRELVKVVEWPKSHYPQGSVFQKPEAILGKLARRDILPDEPIFAEKLAGADSLGGLSVMVPKGYRAISIQTTDVKSVAGFIKPGDRVDVLANHEVSVAGERVRYTRTLFTNILVLATEGTLVDERIRKAKGGKNKSESGGGPFGGGPKPNDKEGAKVPKTVTLALLPRDVETVMLAEEAGSLRLALRSEEEEGQRLPLGEDLVSHVSDSPGTTDAQTFTLPAAHAISNLLYAKKQQETLQDTHLEQQKESMKLQGELEREQRFGVIKNAIELDRKRQEAAIEPMLKQLREGSPAAKAMVHSTSAQVELINGTEVQQVTVKR
jgi:Flp pilus assembly protein CpaB